MATDRRSTAGDVIDKLFAVAGALHAEDLLRNAALGVWWDCACQHTNGKAPVQLWRLAPRRQASGEEGDRASRHGRSGARLYGSIPIRKMHGEAMVTTTARKFSRAESAALAFLIFKRFGRILLVASSGEQYS